MNEEIINSNFDINAKCQSMIEEANKIIKVYLETSNLYVEDGRYSLAYDVKNYLPKLQQENKQLKEQLDLYKNVIDKIKIELHFWNTWIRHNNLQHPFHDDMEKFVFDVEKILLEILDKVDEESDKELKQEKQHYKHIIDELEKRIDKAIDLINYYGVEPEYNDNTVLRSILKRLLEILKGDNK